MTISYNDGSADRLEGTRSATHGVTISCHTGENDAPVAHDERRPSLTGEFDVRPDGGFTSSYAGQRPRGQTFEARRSRSDPSPTRTARASPTR